MTVRCLTDSSKALIGFEYINKIKTQKELAKFYGVSERTINRVLVERGLATPVARIKGEAYQVMQVLKKYGINTVGELEAHLCQAKFARAA